MPWRNKFAIVYFCWRLFCCCCCLVYLAMHSRNSTTSVWHLRQSCLKTMQSYGKQLSIRNESKRNCINGCECKQSSRAAWHSVKLTYTDRIASRRIYSKICVMYINKVISIAAAHTMEIKLCNRGELHRIAHMTFYSGKLKNNLILGIYG